MSLMELPPGADILGAMITPAVLMSAAGTLALATSNRLGRVVDRIRKLSEMAEELSTAPATTLAAEKKALIAAVLNVLERRMRLLQNAVSLLYIAIGIYVATSITLGLTLTARWDYGLVPAVTAIAGALTMFAAVIHLVIETRAAVQSTLVEADFARRQVQRATLALEASTAPPPQE